MAAARARDAGRRRTTSPPSTRSPPRSPATGSSPGERPPPLEDGHHARRAVRHGVRLVWNVVGDPEERRRRRRGPAARTGGPGCASWPTARWPAPRAGPSPSAWRCACPSPRSPGSCCPTERPYWVLLTVAIVLKPDFGSVFAPGRAARRGHAARRPARLGPAGACSSGSPWLLVAMAGFAAVLPWARAANFGLFSVFQTPVIILLLDLALTQRRRAGRRAAGRHPDRLRHRAGLRLPAVAPDLAGAARRGPARRPRSRWTRSSRPRSPASPADRRRARRRNYRALTELQTQLQRRLAEPPPISSAPRRGGRSSSRWSGRRTRSPRRSSPPAAASRRPDLAQVAVLRRAIRQLEDDVRTTARSPTTPRSTPTACSRPVAREVDTARRLVRENAPGRRD